jgi:hypothetical protein
VEQLPQRSKTLRGPREDVVSLIRLHYLAVLVLN